MALIPSVSAHDDQPNPWPSTWQSFYLTPTTSYGRPINPYDFQPNSIYVVTIGLRMVVDSPTVARLVWGIAYDRDGVCGPRVLPDSEALFTREWYPAQADWQNLKFITGSNVGTSGAVCCPGQWPTAP